MSLERNIKCGCSWNKIRQINNTTIENVKFCESHIKYQNDLNMLKEAENEIEKIKNRLKPYMKECVNAYNDIKEIPSFDLNYRIIFSELIENMFFCD